MSVLSTRDQITQIAQSGNAPMAPPGAMQASSGGKGITGKDVLRALRKRILMIFLCLALFTGGAVVGTLLWRRYSPTFSTAAVLAVTPSTSVLTGDPFGTMRATETEAIKQSYMHLATQNRVLQRVLEEPRVRATEWYNDSPEDAIFRLEEQLSVVGVLNSPDLFMIRMSGSDKAELPVIVNTVAQEFAAISNTAAKQSQLNTLEKMRTTLSNLQRDMLTLQENLKTLPRTDLAALQRNIQDIDQQRNELVTQIQDLTDVLRERRQRRDEIAAQVADGTITRNPMVRNQLDTDMRLQNMLQEQRALEAELAARQADFGADHPYTKRIGRQMDTLSRRLESYQQFIVQQVVSMIQSSFDREIEQISSELQRANAQLGVVTERFSDLNENLELLRSRLREIDRVAERIDRIGTRVFEIEASTETIQPVQVRGQAVEPEEPSFPKWIVMVPLGVLLGLGVGVGLALLLEFIDTSVKSPADLSQRLDLPILGVVPHTNDLNEDIGDPHLAFTTNPNSLIGEAFRQIRTCLLFSGPAGMNKSVLVTSPQPGDGRGTVTLNLAAAVAHGGKRVLVVDANFRQPMIRKVFPDCPEEGLSNALVGQGNWTETVHEVEPNLHVMSSGPMPPNPAELLGSDHMRNLLGEMTARYDQVIFDGAPVLLVTDAPILSTLVDGTILVVRAGANTFGVVQRARGALARVGAHVFGVILNGIRITAGGYLRENYRTFYEYHEQR